MTKAPFSQIIHAIDDVRLLSRIGSDDLSRNAGYDRELWRRWCRRTPTSIKALEDVCDLLGVQLVVVPKAAKCL